MIRNAQLMALAGAITPLAARQYAETRGWIMLSEGYDHGMYLLRHPTEPLRQLQIPMRGAGRDFADAIIDVGERLAGAEQKSLLETLNDLLLIGADVLRFRVLSPGANAGVISLDGGLNLLNGAKQSILSAACSVKKPAKHHPRMSLDEATQMLRACQLGQTEHSSYVVKIACPVEAVDGAQFEETGEPFVRRATRLLLRAVERLVQAIEHNEAGKLESEEGDTPIISANLCEAISRMHGVDEKAELTISATWAGVIANPPAGTPSTVVLPPDYFGAIEKIGQRLRTKDAPKPDTFVGTVEELRGDFDEDGQRTGEVMLAIMHEGELAQTRVTLSAEDHALADKAYMSGAKVKMKGHFRPGRRVHEITEVRDFALVE